MVPRGARVLAGGRLAAEDARPAGLVGARPSARRLDVLVDGGPQRVLPARDVPVRAAAGAADGATIVRPCDIGYSRIGVWVADFDRTLTRLRRLGSPPLSDSIGPAGARRACVRNPDGVYVEIMEDDPLARRRARAEQIGVSRRCALGDAVGPRSRPVRSLLLAADSA